MGKTLGNTEKKTGNMSVDRQFHLAPKPSLTFEPWSPCLNESRIFWDAKGNCAIGHFSFTMLPSSRQRTFFLAHKPIASPKI